MPLLQTVPSKLPKPPNVPSRALEQLLAEGVTCGDSLDWLPALPASSVDLFFTSPPYADARAYSRIHPDRYVEWFLDFARPMLVATKESGWFVLNIKNRVAKQ
ncbi:MAG: site-specific DNA-methyltransferase, partial [Vicinamibacteria bacterium]